MIEIAIEEVFCIIAERQAINGLPFCSIVWTENGEPLNIPAKVLKDWPLCGLNNMDFIASGSYRLKEVLSDGKDSN